MWSETATLKKIYHHISPAIMRDIKFIYFYLKEVFNFHENTGLRALNPTIPEEKPQTFGASFHIWFWGIIY